MKKRLKKRLMKSGEELLFLAALSLVLVVPVGAQTSPKIGFVNFPEALQSTAEVKAKIAIVQQFVDSKNKESDTLIEAINKLREQINSGSAPDPRATESQLQKLEVEFRRFQDDIQYEINTRRDTLFQEHNSKLQVVVEELAREGNYDVIFPIDSEVVYIDSSLILTDQVVARYDQKYSGS